MDKLYLHHVLIAVDDLELARQFYTFVLELQEIDHPPIAYPGLWYKIGDGQQQLHVLRSEATIRRNKSNDPYDIHFALRAKSYRDTLEWLRKKGSMTMVLTTSRRYSYDRPTPCKTAVVSTSEYPSETCWPEPSFFAPIDFESILLPWRVRPNFASSADRTPLAV
jgi:hypothetical protein